MKTVTPVLIRRVRFRRWNRHSYSTFCSIGRCINIGCVRKEIAVWTEYDGALPDDSSPELPGLQPQAIETMALRSVSPLAVDAPVRSVSILWYIICSDITVRRPPYAGVSIFIIP